MFSTNSCSLTGEIVYTIELVPAPLPKENKKAIVLQEKSENLKIPLNYKVSCTYANGKSESEDPRPLHYVPIWVKTKYKLRHGFYIYFPFVLVGTNGKKLAPEYQYLSNEAGYKLGDSWKITITPPKFEENKTI